MPLFMFAMRRVIMVNEQGCLLVREGGKQVGRLAGDFICVELVFVCIFCLVFKLGFV